MPYPDFVSRSLRASSYAELNAIGTEVIKAYSANRLVDAEFRCFAILFIQICALNGWLDD